MRKRSSQGLNENISESSSRVVRSSNEPEAIDLAAEATASAPAKSLQPEGRGGVGTKANRRPGPSRKP